MRWKYPRLLTAARRVAERPSGEPEAHRNIVEDFKGALHASAQMDQAIGQAYAARAESEHGGRLSESNLARCVREEREARDVVWGYAIATDLNVRAKVVGAREKWQAARKATDEAVAKATAGFTTHNAMTLRLVALPGLPDAIRAELFDIAVRNAARLPSEAPRTAGISDEVEGE